MTALFAISRISTRSPQVRDVKGVLLDSALLQVRTNSEHSGKGISVVSSVQADGAVAHGSYAELVAATNFSFLRGASHPFEMVAQAAGLGLGGIGICDRNSLSGVVRAFSAARDLRRDYPDFRLVVGSRIVFCDGTPDIAVYPKTAIGIPVGSPLC